MRFPLVPIAALTMGEAVVKDLQVDILAAFPGTYPVDGLLGGDFLEHLTLTLEYYAKRLELTSALSDRQGDRVVRLLLMCTSRVAHTWFG